MSGCFFLKHGVENKLKKNKHEVQRENKNTQRSDWKFWHVVEKFEVGIEKMNYNVVEKSVSRKVRRGGRRRTLYHKCSTGAELSWCQSIRTYRHHFGTGAEVSDTLRHQGHIKSWSALVRPIHRTHRCEPNVIQLFCTRGCTPTKRNSVFDSTVHDAIHRFMFVFIYDR